eukprot:Blabericola_migrator_1__4980@NODE_258_length_10736_cov_58_864373_g216_i0_p3_GENE_NODE_258_length_10736_cov_58_864373_g216_i0NODE_258_length_10736_cov_58_864373_g216_i0_p3_ORF_typecomplete_len258_score35_81_NODE_258_length_10736_cov_58_864373_g216_i0953110304
MLASFLCGFTLLLVVNASFVPGSHLANTRHGVHTPQVVEYGPNLRHLRAVEESDEKSTGLIATIKLNPMSVRTSKLWPNIRDLHKTMHFEMADSPKEVDGKVIVPFTDRSHLRIGNGEALLIDAEGNTLGMVPLFLEQPSVPVPVQHPGYDRPPPQPINLPPPPPPVEGVYQSYPAEMYCRYGCGNIMGVTFPYYYRPFFGYGFPLLGSEPYFPTGYGGNPITPMGAAGLLSPPVPPGSVMAPPGAAIGAPAVSAPF